MSQAPLKRSPQNLVRKLRILGGIPIWTSRRGPESSSERLFSGLTLLSADHQCDVLKLFGLIPIRYYRTAGNGQTISRRLMALALERVRLEPFHLNDEALLHALRSAEPFVYFPNHGNAGDLLIAHATSCFFRRHGLRHEIWDGKSSLRGRTVVYAGGGYFVSHYRGESMIRRIRALQEARRVIILPHTFHACPELTEAADERFTIFCRERQSFAYMSEACPKARVLLDHDMALRLEAADLVMPEHFDSRMAYAAEAAFSIPQKEMVHFLRTDAERVEGDSENDLDLSSLYGGDGSNRDEAAFGAALMLAAAADHQTILTDRLHVAIAGALTGRRVIMRDNDYGKLSAVYAHSLAERPNITFEGRSAAGLK